MRKINFDKYENITGPMNMLQQMFTYLWMKDDFEPNKQFKFKLPHTLVIKNCNIDNWFFSDKNCNISL